MNRFNLNVYCLSEAVSPITQGRGSAGNESLINRESVVTPLGTRYIPVISGNAFRHQIREHGVQYLVDAMGWSGRMDEKRLSFLFTGGNLTEGGGRENTSIIADLHDAMPLMSLLGGCLPNQMLRGRLDARFGRLVCAENAANISVSLPAGFADESIVLRDADSFVGTYQYVRGDAVNAEPQNLRAEDRASRDAAGKVHNDGGAKAKTSQMIFAGQCIIAGSHFVHGFHGKRVSELEAGALLLAMSHWQAAGNTIGGKAAVGHGKLNTMIHCEPDVDVAALSGGYVAHVEAGLDRANEWMDAAFPFADPNAPAPEPKGKKGAKRVAA